MNQTIRMLFRVSFALAAASLIGCGDSNGPLRPGTPSDAPHGGRLLAIPESKNFVEIVCRDPAGQQPGKASEFDIAVYFLGEDCKTPVASPPNDFTMTLNLPDGPKAIIMNPMDSPSAYASPVGPYGHKYELQGEMSFTLDGKSQKLPLAIR